MNSISDIETESSLPTHTVPVFPSSPPVLTQHSNPGAMDKGPDNKSEPPLTQDAEATRPPLKHVNSNETERPPTAQRIHDERDEQPDSHGEEEVSEEEEEEEEDVDPSERIVDFDWDGLHHRYHEAINRCQGEEAELMQEWESLMAYFRVWAQSGHEHETDRTFMRLQTRTAYVQNSEVELEQKRNHYINVVRAFESALNLLKAMGSGR